MSPAHHSRHSGEHQMMCHCPNTGTCAYCVWKESFNGGGEEIERRQISALLWRWRSETAAARRFVGDFKMFLSEGVTRLHHRNTFYFYPHCSPLFLITVSVREHTFFFNPTCFISGRKTSRWGYKGVCQCGVYRLLHCPQVARGCVCLQRSDP